MRWPVVFLFFFLPGVIWSFASPLFSVPDEPAHAVKAVAIWHGQLTGTEVALPDGYRDDVYDLPSIWTQADMVPRCFRFQFDNTADCAPSFGAAPTAAADAVPNAAAANGSEVVAVHTTASRYPLLYYALTGWGGRIYPSARGVYLMRLASAALAGALLTLATRSLSLVIRPRWALLGVLVAASPMVYFLAGSMNPNGFEIAAAIATWAGALAILRWPEIHDTPVPRSLGVALTVAGTLLTFTRSLSPLFLAMIVGLCAFSAAPGVLRTLWADRFMRGVIAVLAVGVTIAALLVRASGHLDNVPGPKLDNGGASPLMDIVGETPRYIEQSIAVFGWLDTPIAHLTFYLWLIVVVAIVVLAFVLAPLRRNLALALTVVAVFVLPIAAQLPRASTQGLPWQGRYTLPLTVGLPLLAIVMLDRYGHSVAGLRRRAPVAGAIALGVANAYAVYWALRRYVNGLYGPLNIFTSGWQPPFGSAVLLALAVIFALTGVALITFAPDTSPGLAAGGENDDAPAASGAPHKWGACHGESRASRTRSGEDR